MAVTDQNVTNEMQFHLLEPANNGASYNSGLYTTSEVAARLNYRLNLFNLLTNSWVNFHEQTATSGSKLQDLSTTFADLMDILDVHYSQNGTMAGGGTYTQLPTGSSLEGDELIATQTPQSLPNLWVVDSAKPLQINLFPAPTFNGTNGQLLVFYIPRLGVFPAVPNGTAFPTGFPDDLTPFIKYGAMADLLSKSGETYDPLRSQICEGLFLLGVEMARAWISGTVVEPLQAQQPFIAPING